MYTAHTSTLPFKDNRLRSQVPTCPSTLANTSNHFPSSWSPGPNHTPRMRIGPSLQRKGPGRGVPPLKAPNRKPSLLSKLTLATATFSYLSIAFFIASMSIWRDTKTVISSAYAETFVQTRSTKKTPRKAGQTIPSLSLRSRVSKART